MFPLFVPPRVSSKRDRPRPADMELEMFRVSRRVTTTTFEARTVAVLRAHKRRGDFALLCRRHQLPRAGSALQSAGIPTRPQVACQIRRVRRDKMCLSLHRQ